MPKKRQPYIVICETALADRRQLDRMDRLMPADYVGDVHDWVANQLGTYIGSVETCTLEEFCYFVNEQELDDLSDCWVGYFYREV